MSDSFEVCFMDTIPEVVRFFVTIREDNRITPVHISLFIAILQVWESNNRQTPLCTCRRELMWLAKISGIATYYRCIKQLHEYGYLRYKPSHDSNKGSLIYFV